MGDFDTAGDISSLLVALEAGPQAVQQSEPPARGYESFFESIVAEGEVSLACE